MPSGVEFLGAVGRLLVVDDEPNIRALLSAALGLTGFDVRVAGGGREALAAATASRWPSGYGLPTNRCPYCS
jgi:CheY-like chemotaxis protein